MIHLFIDDYIPEGNMWVKNCNLMRVKNSWPFSPCGFWTIYQLGTPQSITLFHSLVNHHFHNQNSNQSSFSQVDNGHLRFVFWIAPVQFPENRSKQSLRFGRGTMGQSLELWISASCELANHTLTYEICQLLPAIDGIYTRHTWDIHGYTSQKNDTFRNFITDLGFCLR
jgi:hypothetical protein